MSQPDVKASIVVDNKADGGLVQEHGFALWLEVHGHRILFDTGQGKALAPNAAAMGVDLIQTQMLVLSHGHYDHTGAVAHVLSANPDVEVFCHPGAFGIRYSVRPAQPPHDISMPKTARKALAAVSAERIRHLIGPVEILPGVGITGPIPRRHPLEDTGGPFFLDRAATQPDPIEDDVAMWIDTADGLVVITGCCHSGLINTVEHIRSVAGERTIAGIIGGLHLNNASKQRMDCTCDALREWNPRFVIPCHCTGEAAIAFLADRLGRMIASCSAGMSFEF
jgi:7,8-dihydropterin-6-yl-methyl-4-(beta-D-ribofuranosyl)aminobenzene 5'-phosphate synthase